MRCRTASFGGAWRAPLLGTLLIAGSALVPAAGLAADHSVSVSSNQFSPASVTLSQGDSVTWRNTGGFHNVHFDDGSFTQPPSVQSNAWTASRSFGSPGTFRYYCEAHGGPGGVGMSGTVVVNAAPTTGPPGVTPDAPAGAAPSPGAPTSPSAPGAPAAPGAAPRANQQKAPCRSRRKFRIQLREPDGVSFRSARVSVNGKRVRAVRRSVAGQARQTADVDLRGLRRGTYTVRIVALTTTGKLLRGTRVYRTCAKERRPDKLPKL